MKKKVIFIERKFWEFVSIEKVFEEISKNLSADKYTYIFDKLKYNNSLPGVLRNLLFYKKKEADIYHITGHIHYIALRLSKENTVLTIHDVGFLKNYKGLRLYILKKLYLDLPVKKINFITTISEATREEIIENTNCNKNKIRVIENPLPAEFKTQRRKKFNRECPTILQIGTSPNKNVERLIESIRNIKCKLDIVGKLSQTQMSLLKKNNIAFENSFGLNDKEIIEKYADADIVAFCSTFEGFGLPIIEAQGMQTPVLTSNTDPMKSVAGKGAVLIDPLSVTSIRDGLNTIIDDEILRRDLVKAGLQNINRFDPKEIARQYEDLYEEVINTK